MTRRVSVIAAAGTVAFLTWLMVVAGDALAQSRRADTVARGERLFSERGCVRCHTVGAAGTPIALDVRSMAAKYSEAELARWIRDPKSMKSTAHMPQPELSDDEIRAIAAFVATQTVQ